MTFQESTVLAITVACGLSLEEADPPDVFINRVRSVLDSQVSKLMGTPFEHACNRNNTTEKDVFKSNEDSVTVTYDELLEFF